MASAGVLIGAGLVACGTDAKFVNGQGEEEPPESIASISVGPEDGTEKAPVSTEIDIEVTDGELSEVVLQSAEGDTVEGRMRADGSSWVPTSPLSYDTTYTATVTALDEFEIPEVQETTFSTMSSPSNRVWGSLWNGSEYEYGQAVPIMLDFDRSFSVPEEERANVERRLFVESDPAQPGAWHWFSGNHLEYRPKDYWQPGTVITVRFGLGGLPLGGDLYGETDINSTIKIGADARVVEVDNSTKTMTAKKNGEVVKTMPVSLGKASTPSYYGTMVVMEKLEETVFDTTNEPGCDGKEDGENCYITDIEWAQRLTWSGQFIHSAPWSVGDQGVRNVSHGCINASPSDSEWIFNFTRIGDPVVVTGTEVPLPYGDGFTAWDLTWEDFLAGSYLPPPDTTTSEQN
ncbi:L,D-transpeptidase-like protein [Stackebrandtia endophytica]|uniref:L,D-transpeptidase-like protein n=2 Tax=Stackebrandtia endophytica TaxID=1496996 RepID=A0A543B359_9ACTN|nr:Ig-like domain-containing protein [Stackebrandtia endophytica]TQL79271.1 L,D-transpeptidase-like protein [Stackebrandtia endophytica]